MDEGTPIEGLTREEIEALGSAGGWYANYHARIIAERADDRSAYALVQRERYLALLSGLEKLGISVRNPLLEAEAVTERKAA